MSSNAFAGIYFIQKLDFELCGGGGGSQIPKLFSLHLNLSLSKFNLTSDQSLKVAWKYFGYCKSVNFCGVEIFAHSAHHKTCAKLKTCK